MLQVGENAIVATQFRIKQFYQSEMCVWCFKRYNWSSQEFKMGVKLQYETAQNWRITKTSNEA